MSSNLIKKFCIGFKRLREKYFSGITTRWLINVFLPVVAVVLLACIILSVFIHNFYNVTVRDRIKNEAKSMSTYFESYVYPQYRDFGTCAQLMISDFDKRTLMEMQVSNLSGKVAYSSTGFAISEMSITPDVIEARSGITSYWTGTFETTGEDIISVSVPLYNTDGNVCGTVRMISTLEKMHKYLDMIYLLIAVIGFAIVALTAFSGIYFIKSIVMPVRQINDITLEIAKGNLSASNLNYTSNDEIGQLSKNITKMADELSDSQRVQNDFISQISHELRTPITAIRGWSETMMADDKLDELSHRGVTIINSETNRLSKMVEELLDISRMQNGKLNITASSIDIIAQFEDTVFMMSERSRGENISIVYEPSFDECVINADKDRLKQVFFNVIDNAIKHSNPGSEIIAKTERDDGIIRFIIEDFGVGIKKEDLPFIKEMFYKGSSQKRGSGIGLGVSDEIVRLHGGRLDIESEYGIGTKVTITLPTVSEGGSL